MGYHWFDAPAYQDLDRKLWLALKYSTIAGFSYGFLSAVHAGPRTALEALNPIGRALAITVGSATVGTLGIYFNGRARMKDDIWNYCFGGALVPFYWGLLTQQPGRAVAHGFLFVPLLMSVKAFHSRDDGEDALFWYKYPRDMRGGTVWGFRDTFYVPNAKRPDPGYQPRQSRFS